MKVVVVVAFMVLIVSAVTMATGGEVTYDRRSLIISGTRKMLFSGSIHYPRSTPEMWPALISKAKEGGLNVIQTYVFWNVHEPVQGQFNFEGRYDLVKFIKLVRDQGLYVSLRLGPFIESEWKYGGFPYWLREVPGIVFRSDNEPFKFHMQKYAKMIVDMMKSDGLYASQGGPIILSQIENEYQMVEPAFHEKGPSYVTWAASMAVGLQTGVPWMMCKQQDAPDPVINTCNGMNCGVTFQGPNSPNKPALWTENWTSMYQTYGEEPYARSAEDIAFSVALFIAVKGGSFVNYYMYHGGTNFGRSAASYVTTSYYDDAPIDEYGLIRLPKWGHLKDLHTAIRASSEPLLQGSHTSFSLGRFQEAHVFRTKSGNCVAFLINHDGGHSATVLFWNVTYVLPRKSISILLDCRDVSFNTANVRYPYGTRSTTAVGTFENSGVWRSFTDTVPNFDQATIKVNGLLEQIRTTKDETDYLWYTVRYNHISSGNICILDVTSAAHVVHAFVNGVFLGSAQGSHRPPSIPILQMPVTLRKGENTISLLSVMVGSPDAGAYLESRVAGLRAVRLYNQENKFVDLSNYQWGYQVGLTGEKMKAYTRDGSTKLNWPAVSRSVNQRLTWYKATFDAPSGTDPVALNLASMGKGEAWVNGESIGRYWVSFKTPKGQPSQSLYHVPRSFLNPSANLLVLFEEIGGNPLKITVNTVSVR